VDHAVVVVEVPHAPGGGFTSVDHPGGGSLYDRKRLTGKEKEEYKEKDRDRDRDKDKDKDKEDRKLPTGWQFTIVNQ
jgi:hypothetical protein